MNLSATGCPGPAQLRAFLADEPGGGGDGLEGHVERCRSCQAALAALTATPPLPRLAACPPADTQDKARLLARNDPPGVGPPPDAPDPAPPAIPGYEVQRLLGRGGNGLVYLAWETALGRPVALKVLRRGSQASPDEVASFTADALAVASLNHPGLVHVHRVGEVPAARPEAGGRPALRYCAMEYAPGGNLRQRMAAGHAGVREAAATLRHVARTMHDVHEAGFVHCDLKPENVLRAADGSPRVADFGLALRPAELAGRPADDADLSGTSAYMAPEQISGAGPVGPPSDVYALGVILYEWLTGRPPFAGSTAMITFSLILSQEPPPPRRLRPAVPRDLEAVCLRCLQKEPARRYATAGDLADDLGRWLDGRPVRARPAGPAGLAWRWVRRNRGPSLLGAVALALAGALALGASSLDRHRRQAADADARERHARALTDQKTAEVQALTETATRAVQDLWKAAANHPAGGRDAREAEAESLRRVEGLYRQLVERGGDGVPVRIGLTNALIRAGDLRAYAGDAAGGGRLMSEAVALLEGWAEADPECVRYRKALVSGYSRLGRVLEGGGDLGPARAAYQHAVARTRVAGTPSPALCAVLAVERTHRAYDLVERNDLAGAEAVLREAVADARDFRDSPDPECQKALATLLCQFGGTLARCGALAEAERHLRDCLTVAVPLAQKHPDPARIHELLADAYSELGDTLVRTGRPADALPHLAESNAIWTRLSERKPADPRARVQVATTRKVYANGLERLGRDAEAEVEYRAALKEFEALRALQPTEPYHTILSVQVSCDLGFVCAKQRGPADALEHLGSAINALEASEKTIPEARTQTRFFLAYALNHRAKYLQQLGRRAEADKDEERARGSKSAAP